MMRGGLGGLHQQKKQQDEMAKLGKQLEKQKTENLKQQLELFSKNLEEFTSKYRDVIKINPDFREKFYIMCKEIGVDPLASKSVWNKNLNLNEFYYELAIQIITVCVAVREKTGPLIEANELKKILEKVRKKNDISNMDIFKAIESVSELRCGFQLINLNNTQVVVTIPLQISNDTEMIIKLANENRGWLGFTFFYEKTNSTKIRFQSIINQLIDNGIVWVDDQNFIMKQPTNDEILYWFPGLLKN